MDPVDAQIYDQDVLNQGEQAQIRVYYDPVKPADRRRIDIVLDLLDPCAGETVLDIGCGVGTFAYHAAKRGARAFGIDYSPESIRMATSLCGRFGVGDRVRFQTANATSLPFEEGSFDKIVAADFIEHINQADKALFLKESLRVLKKGGRFIILTPNKIREDIAAIYWRLRHALRGDNIPYNIRHFGLITRREFEAMLLRQPCRYVFHFKDTTRPCLAQVPLIRHWLSLQLVWVIQKN